MELLAIASPSLGKLALAPPSLGSVACAPPSLGKSALAPPPTENRRWLRPRVEGTEWWNLALIGQNQNFCHPGRAQLAPKQQTQDGSARRERTRDFRDDHASAGEMIQMVPKSPREAEAVQLAPKPHPRASGHHQVGIQLAPKSQYLMVGIQSSWRRNSM